MTKSAIEQMVQYCEGICQGEKVVSIGEITEYARRLLLEEQAQKPEASAGLVEELRELCEEKNTYYANINGAKVSGMAFVHKRALEEILSCYTSSYSDKPAKDLQGQHAQMVALAKAHGLDIAADWAVKMSGKTFSEEKPTPSSDERGIEGIPGSCV